MSWCYSWDDDKPTQHAPSNNRYTMYRGDLYGYTFNEPEPVLVDQKVLRSLSASDALARATATERERYHANLERSREYQRVSRARRREAERSRGAK